MASAAETFRAREVYRYYQPKNFKDVPDAPGPSTVSPATRAHTSLPKATNFSTQQSFSDTALTAFAQLIALRLSAQRAIVSLIDHENEFFLAESTSTLSLIDDDSSKQNASLSISGARVPRGSSLCEETLRLVPNQETTAEKTPVFLVPDLLLDEKMSKLDCVKGAPYLRFYCGVALTNKTGINIGCVYVVDDRPRTDFTLDEAQFLTRMAATVMDHLEGIRAKEDIVRVTRMSQALHAFIEGEGTMDGDWQRLKKYNLPANAGVGFSWESNKNDGVRGFIKSKKTGGSRTSKVGSVVSDVEVPVQAAQSPLQHSGINPDARFNFNNSPWSSTSEIPQIPTLRSVFEGFDEAAAKLTNGKDAEFANDGFSTLLHDTFSRASNLVREGMEVDGAVFFDAPFRFYQGRSTLETDPRRPEEKGSEGSSDTEDDHDSRPGPRPQVLRSKTHVRHPGVAHKGATEPLKSDVLGFSTHGLSSWDNQDMKTTTNFTAIDQSLLTSLVRRYPQGELFVFDGDGPVSPPTNILSLDISQASITSPTIRAKFARHKARKRAEILRLLIAFPGARQIFFVPLYDSTSGCFIGSFTWSTSTTRIFSSENHLSYLVAFGHSVMSEVSRLNTMSADRAKGDFISNVSHELRSPLHGILASVEFLADTALDGFQRNLVDTVDVCGRTLLDTIEHVLDFSKIKKYKFGVESSQPMGVVSDLDISAVIEEVLEGVFAGFEFNGLSSQGLADTTQSHIRKTPKAAQTIKVTDESQHDHSRVKRKPVVILDIDFRERWNFPTVPGTWRRLTMNLFGNSLKYTQDGYIKVKLAAQSIPNVNSTAKHDKVDRTMVTLTISDTGRGMSTDFMKTKLFTPFSQEDETAPGTGLGMSMVKQIVDLSGGTIDVVSELGQGTEVKLILPLEDRLGKPDRSPDTSDPLYSENVLDSVRRRAEGRSVFLWGFDDISGKSNIQLAATEGLKSSIRKYITEWFNLSIASSSESIDIVISDESAFLTATKLPTTRPQILLILCSNGTRRDLYNARSGFAQQVEFVSKPCGPHRLAKALLNCLEKEEAFEQAHTERSSIGFSPSAISINKLPGHQSKSQETITLSQRPSLTQRLSSGETPKYKSTSKGTTPLASPSTSATSDISSNNFEGGKVNDVLEYDPLLEISRPLKMLLVEDNPINMMLLATYMKKKKWDYETAANGLIALQAFQKRPQGFDIIFMDVSMPIMTGYEATLAIRNVEAERRLADESPSAAPSEPSNSYPFPESGISSIIAPTHGITPRIPLIHRSQPALIIALTGFSSQKDQEMAFESGVDVFMTKPVRFKEVGRILDGWMKNREMEIQQVNDALGISDRRK